MTLNSINDLKVGHIIKLDQGTIHEVLELGSTYIAVTWGNDPSGTGSALWYDEYEGMRNTNHCPHDIVAVYEPVFEGRR